MKNKYSSNYPLEELIPVLADLSIKYTSYDSSSVSYDIAKQLMKSVIYCIDEISENEIHKKAFIAIDKTSAMEAYNYGLSLVNKKFNKTKRIFNTMKKTFNSYDNICYYDTIMKGMPAFFERYDIKFNAQNHILSLDYPLIESIQDLEGIDLIYEYLQKIQLEQLFLSKFNVERITMIFSNYHKNHSELIHNICSFTLRNSIGCMILESPFHELKMDENGLEQMESITNKMNKDELQLYFIDMLKTLISSEYENNHTLFDYLVSDMRNFAFEFKNCLDNNCLYRIFPIANKTEMKIKTSFVDGISLSDEDFRNFIDEIRDCRFLSDKLIMLNENIKSLLDLKEVLQECFYGDEFSEVFKLLSDEEIKVLKKEIHIKRLNSEDLDEWETALWEFN